MDFDDLIILSQKNEVRIDNHKGFKRNPPHYYHSLRNAFSAYFNTFHTHNHVYHFYAEGLHNRDVSIIKKQLLDENNTIYTFTGFQRFFELFLKDLLKRVNKNLVYQSYGKKKIKTETLIKQIESKTFKAKKFKNRWSTIPFRITIDRFYDLVELVKSDQGSNSSILPKFERLLKKYSFLDSNKHKASLKLLNWYRDNILHNGNRLPSLWLMDYLVTQHFIPIIYQVFTKERNKLADSMYYLTTKTGINILEHLHNISFEFNDLKNPEKKDEVFRKLLHIGHLKELGRANVKMNLYVRNNLQAGYEYNYKDPIGRGKRFAKVEMDEYEHSKEIKHCLCCGIESMVVYSQNIESTISPGNKIKIEWVKCYTCDYHLRHNVGDPSIFNLHDQILFET